MIAQQSLSTVPLIDLYRMMVEESSPAPLVEEHIRARSELALAMLRVDATEIGEEELEELQDRLHVADTPDPDIDLARDTAEREMARVQRIAVEDEMSRRAVHAEQVEDGRRFAPGRNDMVGYLFDAARKIRAHEKGNAAEREALSQESIVALLPSLVSAVDDAVREGPKGWPALVRALRAATALRHENDRPIDPWLRTAIVFELFTQRDGWMGILIDVDPVTLAQAIRAKRIFYGEPRSDSQTEDIAWRLDLNGEELADLFEAMGKANAEWVRSRHPEVDRDLYLEPVRREEPGRPEPHPSILRESDARTMARGKLVSSPMVLFVPHSQRIEMARAVWEDGPPSFPEGAVGLPVYSLGGDPRIRWGAITCPHGLLCIPDLEDAKVLRLGRLDAPDDELVFEQVVSEATNAATTEAEYAERLHEILLRRGYTAIARYDHVSKQLNKPQELILLKPEESLKFIREALPPFVREFRPFYLLPHEKKNHDAERSVVARPDPARVRPTRTR